MLARNFPAAFPQPLKTPENPTTKILARSWLCVVWFSGTLVPGLVCLEQTLLSKINDGKKYVRPSGGRVWSKDTKELNLTKCSKFEGNRNVNIVQNPMGSHTPSR